ncbi:MAG: PDZ domain-containing protein [Planctomycetota bacterium]
MTIRVNTNRMIAALAAGSLAALAGTASAQFVVETANVKHSDATEQSEQQTIVMTTGDEKWYKVTIKDGRVTEAWENGEAVDLVRVKKDVDAIHFLDEDGQVYETIRMGVPTPPVVTGLPLPPSPANFFATVDDEPGTMTIDITVPKVMLGINLSEPGQALRAQLGIGDLPAILVDGVIDDLPASKAGIEQYDIIVSLDGSDGSSSKSLSDLLNKKSPGDELKMFVLRGGKKIGLVAELAAFDAKALGRTAWIADSADDRFPGLVSPPDVDNQIQVWVDRDGELELLERNRREQLEDMRRGRVDRSIDEEEMRSKIAEAMREAERRVLELRDGRLFVREADEAARRAAEHIARLEERLVQEMPEIQEELEDRFEMIEERFDEIERRFERQAERLGDRMERLTDLMEMLADRMERSLRED